jgi:type II secretory pathway component PulF
MIPMIEWGEAVRGLPDAFRVSQEMLEQRAKSRAGLLNFLFPPLLFVGIGAVVLFAISALFLPLVDLISKLS